MSVPEHTTLGMANTPRSRKRSACARTPVCVRTSAAFGPNHCATVNEVESYIVFRFMCVRLGDCGLPLQTYSPGDLHNSMTKYYASLDEDCIIFAFNGIRFVRLAFHVCPFRLASISPSTSRSPSSCTSRFHRRIAMCDTCT